MGKPGQVLWLGEEKFCGYMELMTVYHSVATTQILAPKEWAG